MVLAIETSDILCSVAFWENGRTLLEYNLELPMQHAALVARLVQEGTAFLSSMEPKRSLDNLEVVAVSVGPGSFTGLRIGLSFAQGLAEARGLPLVGVSNHQVLAVQRLSGIAEVFSAIEARRNEIYLARHETGPGLLTEIRDHQVIRKDALPGLIPAAGHLICHKNLQLPESVWSELGQKNTRLLTSADFAAGRLAALGKEKYDRFGADDTETIEPMYMRPFAGVL